MKSRQIQVYFSIIFAGFLYSSSVMSGGFQVWEQDASGIGDYHSGGAAEALNAGTQFYNPAGMNNLKHIELSAGIAYIPLQISYFGNVGFIPDAPPMAVTTATSKTNNFIPNLFFVYPVDKYFAFGFGVTVPFGSSTEYPIDNPLSAAATKTQLQTINLNPSIAIKLSQYFSVGLGFNALWGKAIYDSAAPFLTPPVPLSNQLSGWGYGWNVGALLYLTPATRMGISYRSRIQLDGRGRSQYIDPFFPTSNDTLSATLQLPATTILSFYTDINPDWALLFSAYYTSWDVFTHLNLNDVLISNDPTTLPILVPVNENYVNSWNFALGAHYWISSTVMFKVGVGYDETPIQPGYRDVRLPDAAKYALALGVHWDIIPLLTLDAGWIHFFVPDAVVDNSNAISVTPAEAKSFATIAQLKAATQTNGISRTEVNVVGMQLSWKIN